MCWPSSSTWPRARSSRATRNAWPGPSSSSPPPWTRNWLPWTAVPAAHNGTDLAIAFFLMVILQVAAGIVVKQVFELPQKPLKELPLADRAAVMLTSSTTMLLTMILSLALIIVAHQVSWRRVCGWGNGKFREDLRIGAAAFVMMAPLVYGLQVALVQWFPSEHPLIELLKKDPNPRFLAICVFSAVIVAPLVEEYLFRRLLQGWLETKVDQWSENELSADAPDSLDLKPPPKPTAPQGLRFWTPIILSATPFAALHMTHGPDPCPLFLLSLGLGYLHRKTGRLLPCILVHFFLNGFSMLQLLLWLSQA